MSLSLSVLLAITITLTFGLPNNNIKEARYPQIEGFVVLEPGTNDANTCFTADGYAGGGFYVQDQSGAGIWVCPESNTLVSDIHYGDRVRLTGLAHNNQVQTLTITASSIQKIGSSGAQVPEVIKPAVYSLFQSGLEFGDLISYEGYVQLWWIEDVGAGFGITDCDENIIKGWWTAIDGVDVYDLFGFATENDDPESWQDSYYEMTGFYEVYNPYCESWGGTEFQPRLQNIVKIDNPCT